MQLSIVLATYNEDKNLEECLKSVVQWCDEIIVVDGSSNDNTVEIARKYRAHIIVTDNPPIFHINKQKAINAAKGEWILQLDADERVSPELSKEILFIINADKDEIALHQQKLYKLKLFQRHQRLIEKRDGKVGTVNGDYVAFFIPRLNYFLGKYLHYGGVYPDGVIRLIKKNYAYLPSKNVHEQYKVSGKVGWLQNDLLHLADTSLLRYLIRFGRYTDLLSIELKTKLHRPTLINTIDYMVIKPVFWFGLTFVRHKGFLDFWQGLVFSLFSSLRFPVSYLKFMRTII